jgi:ferritin-like metal-binding protein YciE
VEKDKEIATNQKNSTMPITKSTEKKSTSKASSNGTLKASSNGSSKNSSVTKENKKQKTLEDLFEDGLKDIYSAEQQLIKALPKMVKAAESEELQDAFEKHLAETKRQAERIEKIFSRLKIDKSDIETCEAMKGLIEEADQVIEEYEQSPVRDAALIIGAQKVEHYEIAAYGSLCELADVLGHSQFVNILEKTLQEEGDTDHKLSAIAQDVNDDAYELAQNEYEESYFG